MRTILFRGQKSDTKEMIYGDLIQLEKDFKKVVEILDWSKVDNKKKSKSDLTVIPETVGQFSGLTDKNGTKIFEGDIIAHFDLENKKQIIFKNGAFGYMTADGYDFISYSENRHNFDFRDNKSDFIEVVGNIHENPELLNTSF